MTTTPPEAPHQPPGPSTGPSAGPSSDGGPRVGWDDIKDLGRIHRPLTDRRVGGVAAGIARHLDIDPLIVRVAFVVLALFGGVGLLLYLACWLLLPQDGTDRATIALDRRSRSVALVLVGVIALVLLVDHGWWGFGTPWLAVLLIAVVALVVSLHRSHEPRRDAPPASQPAPPAAGPAYGPAPQPTTYDAAAPVAPAPGGPSQPAGSTDYAYVEPPRPANPRKRGPILFGWAFVVALVGLGILAVVDLAGADVPISAYPALVMGVCGVGLLLGSFFGRAGGLILVGLLAWPVTAGLSIVDHADFGRSVERPGSAAAVQPRYEMDNGELVVDLTRVRNPRRLDGRTIHVTGHVGHLDLRVPRNVNVVAHLDVENAGGISAFGQDVGGFGHELDTTHFVGAGWPTVTIDATIDVGAIDLHTASPDQEVSR